MAAMTSEAIRHLLQRNLDRVHETIASACMRAGRSPDEITLVAVTKYVPPSVIAALLACGVRNLGENRIQQLEERVAEFGSAEAVLGAASGDLPCWHMIGHLQRNKVRKLVPRVRILHSLDSLRLAEEVSRRATDADCRVDAFVEVNVSGELSKDGLPPGELPALLEKAEALTGLRTVGLMTMAPQTPDAEGARRYFAALRALRDAMRDKGLLAGEAGLSMGMSNDFAVAVEEGATSVRVGSALYEGLPPASKG